MPDQTTVNRFNGNRPRETPDAPASTNGFKRLVSDIAELAELQIRLLSEDLKQTAYRIIAPVVLVVVGGALLLGCIPVLAAAAAQWMVARWEWTEWGALLLNGGVILGVSVILLAVAWVRLRRCVAPLERSVDELGKNLSALRGILSNGSTNR